MKMLKLPSVSFRVNDPIVLSDDRVDNISAQVLLFSLQKKSSDMAPQRGGSHGTVSPAAVFTV